MKMLNGISQMFNRFRLLIALAIVSILMPTALMARSGLLNSRLLT
jgi:hypothetical protein